MHAEAKIGQVNSFGSSEKILLRELGRIFLSLRVGEAFSFSIYSYIRVVNKIKALFQT